MTSKFRIYRTNGINERYADIGEMGSTGNKLLYNAHPNSVTTFFSEE